jgi:hypothetical protein
MATVATSSILRFSAAQNPRAKRGRISAPSWRVSSKSADASILNPARIAAPNVGGRAMMAMNRSVTRMGGGDDKKIG